MSRQVSRGSARKYQADGGQVSRGSVAEYQADERAEVARLTWRVSVGKESACNAGDPGSIPGSGRSAGEGKGYPLQYSWASLVAQLVKNPPAMRETLVQFLSQEDLLEKGKATHSSILGLPWWLSQ